MHKYLRAVGFSDLKRPDIATILNNIIEAPTIMRVAKDSEGNEFAELYGEFGMGFGIVIRGIFDEEGIFKMDYYFPFFEAVQISTEEYIEIEKYADKEAYAGICDEIRLGVTLIFYLQNVADYLAERKLSHASKFRGAKLAGLSVDGKIILPVTEKDHNDYYADRKSMEHNKLMAQAREGDEDAIESLTMEDMDTYMILSQRVRNEDILSIVSSTFMPSGIESDHYSVIGLITDYNRMENRISGERIYILSLECNEMKFDVCINEKDLIGEPAIGRRFKGVIWMQGNVLL